MPTSVHSGNSVWPIYLKYTLSIWTFSLFLSQQHLKDFVREVSNVSWYDDWKDTNNIVFFVPLSNPFWHHLPTKSKFASRIFENKNEHAFFASSRVILLAFSVHKVTDALFKKK